MSRRRVGPQVWARDLALGVRFAAGGGRESWARTLLTAVGVGVGVTMLLLAASLPTALIARTDREHAREPHYTYSATVRPAGPRTVLVRDADTTFRSDRITGLDVRADGAAPVVPPGLNRLPGLGEMAVSPALKALLDAPGNALLRQRLSYRQVAVIGDAGLTGPRELFYYAGVPTLTTDGYNAQRITGWGITPQSKATDAILVLLIVVAVIVLLLPVGVFIGAAVRFGGERRDRRLAALRLVGADRRMTSRIAAGESAFGALMGLLVGAAAFAAIRPAAGGVSVIGMSVFSADLRPVPLLAVLIAVAVPLSAIVVTLLALRQVSIEPLGVVRSATPKRRRLLWRLAMPVVGAALLLPLAGRGGVHGTLGEWQVGLGVGLLLVGLTALLPWLVEATVRRIGGRGTVAFQLACRRLQLTPGSAARMVSGITVAVAGAIAVMTLMSGVAQQYTHDNGPVSDTDRVIADLDVPAGTSPDTVTGAFHGNRGVASMTGYTAGSGAPAAVLAKARAGYARDHDPEKVWELDSYQVGIADCATVRALTTARDCRPGSAYVVNAPGERQPKALRPGAVLDLDVPQGPFTSMGPARLWTVPAGTQRAQGRPAGSGSVFYGLLATPQALSWKELQRPRVQLDVRLATSVPDAVDLVRNAAIRFDPSDPTMVMGGSVTDSDFASVRNGVMAGAALVLVLIGASLLVSVLEQLRERKRLLAVLVAFGTRRSSLGVSVLWQTAVPVALGLVLAVAGGLGLGRLLQAISRTGTGFDWSGIGALSGFAAAVVAVVTLLSMPVLWRLMRPDGLRTE